MQVSSSWFGTLVPSNRFSHVRSLPLEPCSTTSVSATSYPLSTRPYSSLSFLVSQRKGFSLASLFFSSSTELQTHRSSDSLSSWFMRLSSFSILLFYALSRFAFHRSNPSQRDSFFQFPLRNRSAIFVIFRRDFRRSGAFSDSFF